MRQAQSWFTTAVWPIIFVSLIFFMLQALVPGFETAFILISSDVYQRPWILLTSMFLHGSLDHLLFNMYGLFIFGPILEAKIGPKRFWGLYLTSGLIAGFLSHYVYESALGASGAIMGMLGTLIILMPDLDLLFFFVIPMKLWMAGIVWIGFDVFGALLGFLGTSNIGHFAHLAGIGCGLLYGLYLKRQQKQFTKKFEAKKTDDALTSQELEEYLRSGRL